MMKELLYRPLKEKMRANSLSMMLFFVLNIPILFFLTPLILKYLGKELYGVWAILWSILNIIEFSLSTQPASALAIEVPKYDPDKKPEEINRLVSTLAVSFFGTALLLCGLFLLLKGWLFGMFFKVSPQNITPALYMFAACFFLYMINYAILSVAHLCGAFNLFYINNIMHTVTGYARAALIWLVLWRGYGVKGLVYAQMGTIILETAVVAGAMFFVFPKLKISPALFDIAALKRLYFLSFKLLFTRAAGLVNMNADKLIIGFFINPVAAAFYQIGASVAKYVSTVPDMLGIHSLLPAASELKAKKQNEKIKEMFERINKYIFFAAIFFASGAVIFGGSFIRLWLGDGYGQAYSVLVFLSIAYTYNLISVAATYILNGIERMKEIMAVSGAAALLNVVLSAALAWKFGLNGVLWGTAISMAVGATAVFVVFYRITGFGLNITNVFIKPLAAVAVAYLPFFFIKESGGWLVFFIRTGGFTLIFLFFSIFIFRQFDERDFGLFKNMLGKKAK